MTSDGERQQQRPLEARYQKYLANRESRRISVEEEAREQTLRRELQRERDHPRRGSERPSPPTPEALASASAAVTKALDVFDASDPPLGFIEWLESPAS